jgi:formate hydrogenlyase subunit 3/multisubunit Na+/H+ antiporter MnhD subunit
MLTGLALADLGFLLLAGLGLAASRLGNRATAIVCLGSLIVCAINTLIALAALWAPAPELLRLPIGFALGWTWLALDPLSAYFLLAINLVGAIVSLYAVAHEHGIAQPARRLVPYPLFLFGLNLVPLAADAFSFLVAWEFMSLASWALILARAAEDPAARHAAQIYLAMAVAGALALLAAFGVMGAPLGQYDFAALRGKPAGSLAVFILVLLGAGSKAGLVPLHAWLPLAHPAAPSHVSALMSGVMTKVALYAVIRLVFDLNGQPVWWWGGILLAIGAGTALVGVLFALIERDMKTVLAWSTIENIGIIAGALGLALAFAASGLPALAGLALTAALLHALNHALFKSLLFMGAGAVLHATGSRDLEMLGGLGRRMPRTGWIMLVGALALAALPPLNGFAGEWLLFQGLLGGIGLPQASLKFILPVAAALFALTAALAAAVACRLYGIAFLGRPRSAAATDAHEVAPAMQLAMAVGAGLCLLFGLLPAAVAGLAGPAVAQVLGTQAVPAVALPFAILPAGATIYVATGLALAGLVLTALVLLAAGRLSPMPARRAPAWDCGFPDRSAATQYTAASLAQPLRRVFGRTVFAARETVTMPEPGDVAPARHGLVITDRLWDGLYVRLGRAVEMIGDQAARLQRLTIRGYLMLMFGALVVLLAAVAVSR